MRLCYVIAATHGNGRICDEHIGFDYGSEVRLFALDGGGARVDKHGGRVDDGLDEPLLRQDADRNTCE
jgi:hypothetical protein